MSGHHPWSELRAKMSPERQARIKAEADNMRLGTLQKIVTALGGELSLRVLIDGCEYDLQKSPQMAMV